MNHGSGPDDDFLARVLASAAHDEPPWGAEMRTLVALASATAGEGTELAAVSETLRGGVAGVKATTAGSLTTATKAALVVVGTVGSGLGVYAAMPQPSSPAEDPARWADAAVVGTADVASAAASPIADEPPPPDHGLSPPAPSIAGRTARLPPRLGPAKDDRRENTLATETALLRAAHGALLRGDKDAAQRHLTEYDARTPQGVLRREADILWARAR